MAKTKITAKSGGVTVTFDQTEVIAQVDRLLGGAVRTFLDAAHRQADPIVERVRTQKAAWTDKTGKSRVSTEIEERISPTSLELVVLNRQWYIYRAKYSVRTTAGMDREASQVANRTWANLRDKVERSNDPLARRRIARKFISEASGGLINGWWTKRDPSAQAIRTAWRKDLAHAHGEGAPNAKVAGKHVWGSQVRTPMKKAEKALVAEARDALDKLAEG